ncbi:MAG: hypothetical protein IPK82_39155 [Polyangiaceae bacterium]|nr:hypothetical protein [Polyangiaceae bacterium]
MKKNALLWAAFGWLAIWPACDGGQNAEKVCEPGTEVFCRPCPGNPNEPGTRTCNADGSGFDECVSRTGQCPVCTPGDVMACTCDDGTESQRECNSSGTDYEACQCAGTGGSGGGTGGAGGGTGGTTGKALFEACIQDDECESQNCPMGYCTQECAKIQDCPFGASECVSFKTITICMPTCKDQSDCDVYGAPSECGYTHAVDEFPVTTCADWVNDLALPPDGSECVDDIDCNLGHEGQERVCSFQSCTTGCYEDKDCPIAQNCSSMGALGKCE